MVTLPEDPSWREKFEYLAFKRVMSQANFLPDEKISLITIKGEIYQAKYLFRQGKSMAYLTGYRETVVKEYRGTRVGLAHYEVAATKFYQEQGIPVVPITDFWFDAAGDRAYVVKPFVEGMTTDYLITEEVVHELGQEIVDRLIDAENKLASNVFSWHEGGSFSYWMEENGLDEQDFGEYQWVVLCSDIWRDGATIFTLEHGWQVLDP